MLTIKTKSAWQLGLRRRSEALTASDRVHAFKQNEMVQYLVQKRSKLLRDKVSPENDDAIQSVTRSIVEIKSNLDNYLTVERAVFTNVHKHRTIASFSDEWIYSNTRFHSVADLQRLYSNLQIPDKIILDNKSVASGEEALLVTLYRLTFPRRLSDLSEIFGREYSHWSRVIKYTTNWLVKHWWYLQSDHTDYWKDKIPGFNTKIEDKIISLGFRYNRGDIGSKSIQNIDDTDAEEEPERYRVFGFIDNTIIRTCRPGGSAVSRGPNAPRYHHLIQQAFYTGWKKIHGVKFQTVSLPNGMFFHVFGPVSCRRGDRYTLPQSEIEETIREMMYGVDFPFHLYGDSAYSRGEEITAHHEGTALTPRQIAENRCFNACRETVEWNNKEIKNAFKASVFDTGLRLKGMNVSEMLQSCILFSSCLCAMYGNQTSEYFGYSEDILDDWMSLGPRY